MLTTLNSKITSFYEGEFKNVRELPIEEQIAFLSRWKKLFTSDKNPKLYEYLRDNIWANPPTLIYRFLLDLQALMTKIHEAVRLVQKVLEPADLIKLASTGESRKRSHSSENGGDTKRLKESSNRGNSGTKEESKNPCDLCGWHSKGCKKGHCHFYKHPDRNEEGKPFSKSSNGIALMKLGSNRIIPSKKLSEDKASLVSMSEVEKNRLPPPPGKEGRPKVSKIAERNLLNYTTGKDSFNPIVSARIAGEGDFTLKVGDGILDSGSFGYVANYVSQEVFELLHRSNLAKVTPCPAAKVCSMHKCFHSKVCADFNLELYSGTGKSKTVTIQARVAQCLPYYFIIGLRTIRQYKLAKVFDDIFEEELATKNELDVMSMRQDIVHNIKSNSIAKGFPARLDFSQINPTN
jgi:hypothetical protein